MFHKISLLSILFTILVLPLSAKEKTIDLSPSEVKAYKEQCRQMVDYLQGTLNFLGDPQNPSSEKEIIINNSYLKVFKNDKVQIEDDLDEHRDVPMNKDVQAYLKDVVFFFKSVHFTFDIRQIAPKVNPSGQIYFKISLNRHLHGITVNNDTVDNNEPRFIEINLNPVKSDLKIASVYTHVLNEGSQMKYWWNHLTPGWKSYFGRSIRVYDSLPLSSVIWFSDSIMVVKKEVPIMVSDSIPTTDSLITIPNDTDATRHPDTLYQIVPDTVPANTSLLNQVLQYLRKTRRINISLNLNINNLDPLSELSELRFLNASHTLVDNLVPLRSLSRLEVLNITGCPVLNLDPLRYVSSLKELDAGFTQVTNTEVVGNLKNLESLDLSFTRVDTIKGWSGLTKLRSLNLSGTAIHEIDSLAPLTQLTHLNLARCRIKRFAPVAALKQLQDLNLDSTNIHNVTPLAGLKSLTSLHLSGTKVTDLMPLAGLNNLKYIYCDNSGIDAQAAARYIKANPGCQVIFNTQKLNSWWNQLPQAWKNTFQRFLPNDKDITVIQLHRLLRIDSLDLSNNKNIRSLKPLEMMWQLNRLNISGTSVSSLSPLAALGNLQYIDLSHTHVSNLRPLNKLRNLKEINIENTAVSDLLPLTNNGSLSIIYADHSRLTATAVSDFRKQQPSTLVLFQSNKLLNWWNALSHGWQEVFSKQSDLSKHPTTAQLQQLVNLTSLQINNVMDVTDLSVLREFSNLQKLMINNTNITRVAPLVALKSLKVLKISNSPVSDILPLARLRGLTELDLENTGVEDLTPLQNLRKLQTLNLSGTRVKNLKPLENLTNLQTLIINNTRIRSLKYILQLRKIKLLRCDHTNINSKRLDEFKQSHPDAQVIYY